MESVLSYFVPCWKRCGHNEPEMWNVFSNYYVEEHCMKEIKKYLRAPNKYRHKKYNGQESLGFEALCEEFDSIFMNQFWSRYEYEYSISEPFPLDENNNLRGEFFKKDVYWTLKPNIPFIVNGCIAQYKQWKKEH